MGRRLHSVAPKATKLWEIEGAEHNDIVLTIADDLREALTNGGEFSFTKDRATLSSS